MANEGLRRARTCGSWVRGNVNRLFQGFCIGTANIIPGVSGGTIALMLGIYEELIQAVGRFDLHLLRLITARRWRAAVDYLPWKFLLPLLLGIALAVMLLARLLEWLYEAYPVYLYAFFFGLILASVPIISSHIRLRTRALAACMFAAAAGMFLLVGMIPAQTPETALFIFLSGVLAISTMILPGISGSFVLVLIGKYKFILAAINDRDLYILTVFGLGCITGIVAIVGLLKWLLDKYHDLTMTCLTGIVLGSLRKLWPWKDQLVILPQDPAAQALQKEINVWPDSFSVEVLMVLAVAAFGFMAARWLAPRPKHF